ncbi:MULTISPECIES: cytochrome c oxidase assembly protein [Streptomyces]|uniref:Cytochrome c oxidase assembly protein n=2 Tax=Streptomyces TaxID=1883 RepID=A0A2U9NV05_STRAS|nr:cytochrome c oxidase assembly protein [Streptomyces actuosus]AWT41066.1 cytochrome c oxidase assembly protein [Streptomyces actuosus]MBM4826431.1 cytochrome c oxidase assembly protein [Streptomyces actuosus]
MSLAHTHPEAATGPGTAGMCVLLAGLLVAAVYWAGAARLRRRGDAWPRRRDVSFVGGVLAIAWATAGPTAARSFTGHMAEHLLAGMAGPLLIVLARPLTLALRALPVGRGRRSLLAVAHSRPMSLLVFPPLAALLDAGGLWLLYRTRLFAATQDSAFLHALVHAHVVAAGLLFSFAVCRLDPLRRRWSLTVRGGTLLAAGALHAVLARTLYASPPPGTTFAADDLHNAARLMYYGGDLAELGLAVVIGVGWYAARARRDRHVTASRPAALPTGSGGRVA